MFNIEEQLKLLPEQPGVYIMKDKNMHIIYIGKAVSLKNRVRQYFQNSKNHSPKVRAMVENIAEFEYIVTDSELEALILECNLIKKHRPKYNILLKDDKHYPYIKVTMNEEYPRVIMARKIERDGAKYFGPYSGSYAIRETIDIIKKLFKVRTCSRAISSDKALSGRPCLNYYIGRCSAPCRGNVDKEEYKSMMKEICLFLSGEQSELMDELKIRMDDASEKMEYEKAADYRDKIIALKQIQEKQKVLSSSMEDEDVIAFAQSEDSTCIQIFFVRGGKLIGREHFMIPDGCSSSSREILTEFVKQFYSGTVFVPRDILLQEEIDETNIIESWLESKKGSKVHIKVPKVGEKKQLVNMVAENAAIALKNFSQKLIKEEQMSKGAIEELSDVLGLDELPSRIEAFDISNIQGVDPVGSMVVFIDGKPKNSEYRRFKIKSVSGPDDYGSMQEVLERRFKRGLEELKMLKLKNIDTNPGKFSNLPDLVMIDGGEGQVNAVLKVLCGLDIDIPVCGMVKDDRHRTRGLIYDGRELPVSRNSEAFKLITRIQDEAHRFAISYHRSLRNSRMVKSVLNEIKGIGDTRKKALMKHFGSIDKIKEAEIEELKSVQGMNESSARSVYDFFHKR
ncbi:MAG TPA: excinuclease ABC subunit C [Clostridiaceae bacterium]|nr:excinuclease ABC subunit C [Clostridiaceae bacterium]